MSLDITFKELKPILCPHCGELVKKEETAAVDGSGRYWYPILEYLGYYVPYDKRTAADADWYGKDMTLTGEQIDWILHYMMDVCKGTREQKRF